MKLIELNIVEFGCLKDVHVSLSDGINIIGGDNESGKSTVMLFIKFMLYGLPRKSARSYDRERSISFDGHRAAGSMVIESSGRQYRIERQAVATGKLSESLKITDLYDGSTLSGEPGELFLGVPCEVFENSCGVSQMKVSDINKAQTASAIENMLVSADESIDVKKILDRIDSVRKEYRLNKGDGGILYREEREIADLEAKLDSATKKHLSLNETTARLAKKEQELERIAAELERSEATLDQAKNAGILERFAVLESNQALLTQKKLEHGQFVESMSHGDFIPSDAHIASLSAALERLELCERKARQRQEEYSKIARVADNSDPLVFLGEKIEAAGGKTAILSAAQKCHKSSGVKRISGIITLISGIICAVAGVMVAIPPLRIGLIAAGVISFILGICLLAGSQKAQKQQNAICDEYDTTYADLESHISLCLQRLKDSRVIGSDAVIAEGKLTAAKEDVSSAEDDIRALLALTGKSDGDGIRLSAENEMARLSALCQQRDNAERELYTLEAVINNDIAFLGAYDKETLKSRTVTSAVSIEDAERMVKFNRAKKDSIDREILHLRENLAALRAEAKQEPVEISDKILALKERLAHDTEYFEALILAKQSIEQASVTLSGNLTPEISKKAGEMLSLISDGRHLSVQTTKNLDLSVEQDGFGVAAELLSGGTRDAAYLCLRIALMLRLFTEELPPLIMDEALCQLDDGRAELTLTLLHKLSATGLQCVILTCHSREAELCRKNDFESNIITL